ncbi:MAG: hypothetical protein K5669_07100 [Lachnospiraceae bacterium]|nr:hypothetical protein [Lachnospiraceae bacterium]
MRNMINTKRILAAFASAAIMITGSVTVTGCADTSTGKDEQIELLDPVSVSVSCAPVTRRNIYNYKVISAICAPKVSECAFETGINFKAYEIMPGEEAQSGDVLISADTTDLDKRIKAQKETIEGMEEDYSDSMDQLMDSYYDLESEYNYNSQILANLENSKPDETSSSYAGWAEDYNTYDAKKRYSYVSFEKIKLQVKEKEELYKLDIAYQKNKLNDLYRQKNEKMLLSDTNGVVVGLGFWRNQNYSYFYSTGDWINKKTVGAAVADLSQKELRTDYVNQGTINKAEDIYAIVDGERYEVEYQSMSSEEYKRLSEKNGSVYSTFKVTDPEDKIAFGDFAVIVIVNGKREDVLSVPSSSIVTDASGSYVYLFENDTYKEKYIKTGITEGQFTEVLSGLDEGQMVKCEYKIKSGAKEATIENGSISYSFSSNGYLFYPSADKIGSPVTYGTVYIDEILVSRYQKVEKGDVIAKVHVISDSVELGRAERELQRLNEKLDSLIKDGEEDNKYAIKAVRNQIADKQEYIGDLKKDAAVKQIVAPYEGIITEVTDKVAGDLLGGNDALARIAGGSSCFIMVEDEDGKLSYGNTVEVAYKDPEGNSKTVTGEVKTANAMTISREMNSGYAIVQLPVDAIAEMAGSERNSDGWWSRVRVDVKATLRSMDNVLIIPKSAVYDVNGTPYVTIKDENGNMRMASFIAGGSDSTNYWVAEGLTEGTKICWE